MDRTDIITPCLLVKNDEYWLPYALKAVQGIFSNFVIYDVGSEDSTREVIEAFIYAEKEDCDIIYRPLPHCEPIVQGTFRNSMIAETRNDWYLILDADEVYRRQALMGLLDYMPEMIKEYEINERIYGIVRRYEVSHDLTEIHGLDEYVKHHRVYHRTAIWKGTHPGEAPVITQKPSREERFPASVGCYHFHQPERSRLDADVPGRSKRRYQHTYLRGDIQPVDLFKEVPILTVPIGEYNNPILEKMRG